MMPIFAKQLPIHVLSFILLLGAFSRFTHGVYTPSWYAFQEYHAPEDSSFFSRSIPFYDTIIGLMLLFSNGKTRLFTIGGSFFAFTLGLVMQVASGKDFRGDVGLVVLALAAFIGAYKG
ncbi:hypothetical protein BJX63DRAFT_397174 [Aspergillus granulosus]|uniref:Uncharacterized protein n=1 Tax=Aspergillus granulosus TaxID=176169 RepID=A0ABR4H9M5_9EURO